MSTAELIFLIIAIAFTAGGWIANKVREMNAEARRRQREQEAPLAGAGTPRERLDALASRRREELRRAAAARGQRRPTNLTAADNAERERARLIYQQRQAELQQQREAQARALAEQQRLADLERVRRAQEARSEMHRRRHSELEERRRREEQQRLAEEQAGKRAQAEAQRQAQQRRAATAASPTRATRSRAGGDAVDAVLLEGGTREQLRALLKGGGLRQAILLREILDRPLAERE